MINKNLLNAVLWLIFLFGCLNENSMEKDLKIRFSQAKYLNHKRIDLDVYEEVWSANEGSYRHWLSESDINRAIFQELKDKKYPYNWFERGIKKLKHPAHIFKLLFIVTGDIHIDPYECQQVRMKLIFWNLSSNSGHVFKNEIERFKGLEIPLELKRLADCQKRSNEILVSILKQLRQGKDFCELDIPNCFLCDVEGDIY